MADTTAPKSQNNKQPGVKLPPALDPERAAVTQPFRDFIARGLITELKATFSGGMIQCVATLGGHVSVPDGQTRENLAPGMAKALIEASGLWSSKKGDKSTKAKDGTQLPQKSLVKKDFEGKSDDQLRTRVVAVATALGDTVARGRIGSLRYMREGVDTFDAWWAAAPCQAKTRLVMDGKHHSTLTQDEHRRFATVITQCPFRGAVPTPAEEEETAEGQVDGEQS